MDWADEEGRCLINPSKMSEYVGNIPFPPLCRELITCVLAIFQPFYKSRKNNACLRSNIYECIE